MKRRLILTLCLLFLLVLVSCTGPVARTVRPQDFYVGKQGLEVEFLDEAPPRETFETSEFDVQLDIHNRGAFDLIDPFVAMVDLVYDTDKVELEQAAGSSAQPRVLAQLEGRSINFPEGETNFYPLAAFRAKEIFGKFQQNTATFIAQICYPYQTSFADEVCVDTSGSRPEVVDQACEQRDKTYGRGQGAPVEVVAVDSQMIPKGVYVQPQFTIHLEHKGDGTISYRDVTDERYDIEQCENIETEQLNRISAKVTLGVDELTCLPEEIVFRGGEATIQCQLLKDSILGVSSNYQTNLVVELGYLYTESFRKDVAIEKSLDIVINEPTDPSQCNPWEEFDNEKGTCVSDCVFQAQRQAHKDPLHESIESIAPLIAQEGITTDANQYLWNEVGCIYKNSVDCRDNPALCLTEEPTLCPPGEFCGLHSCVLNNAPPRIDDIEQIGLNKLQFFCKDQDDSISFTGTCGCSPIATYGFVTHQVNCTNPNVYEGVAEQGVSTVLGVRHEIDIGKDALFKEDTDKYVCLKVTDRFGEEVITSRKLVTPLEVG